MFVSACSERRFHEISKQISEVQIALWQQVQQKLLSGAFLWAMHAIVLEPIVRDLPQLSRPIGKATQFQLWPIAFVKHRGCDAFASHQSAQRSLPLLKLLRQKCITFCI